MKFLYGIDGHRKHRIPVELKGAVFASRRPSRIDRARARRRTVAQLLLEFYGSNKHIHPIVPDPEVSVPSVPLQVPGVVTAVVPCRTPLVFSSG